jgi:hypothetical protein
MVADIAELRGGIGPLLMASEPRYDPIAILYSPASFRVQWMQDQRAHGEAWTQRQADTEDEDNALRIATRDALAALERQGFTPRFVTDEEIASGLLQRAQYRLLILPQVLALSSSAARQIGRFRNNGGRLALIGEAGIFDAHGRLRAKPFMVGPLAPDHGRTIRIHVGDALALRDGLLRLAAEANLTAPAKLDAGVGPTPEDIRLYRFRRGSLTVLALQREQTIDTSAPELASVVLSLRKPTFVCNLHTHQSLGKVSRIPVTVGAGIPTVIALAARPFSTRCMQSVVLDR